MKIWIFHEFFSTFVVGLERSRCWDRNIEFFKYISKLDGFEACRKHGSIFIFLDDLVPLSYFLYFQEIKEHTNQFSVDEC